ncbi:hypothetical protein FKM82_027388 [Ascaphus truei]
MPFIEFDLSAANIKQISQHAMHRNQSLYLVSLDDIPKPQIIIQPETTMAVVGKDIRFTCSAASSSSSPMTFAWKKDSEILHNSETESFANVWEKGDELMEYTTILHLRNVTFAREGRYQCIITNHFGSTYSNKARLTVNVLPSFIKTPRDITIRKGTTARLECAAEGHPTPEIAWQKDGGVDFPAARERRMHVMPDDDVFFIMDVKIEDMGVYSCTAQNSAGSVSANATLTVLETPFLVHPLEDHFVSAGATLALQCKASGSPPPRITWLKGDEPLVMTERHHFTPGNQLLIIRNVVLEDAGRYTCEMSNTLGTERAHSHVSVSGTERAHSHVSVSATAGCLAEQGKMEGTMTFGIITIAVVCSIVLTSLVWVCIIYQTRKKSEEYSVTNTDETIVPPDVPSYSSSQGMCSSDGAGNVDVEACNVAYRQPTLCIGCNTNEACKTADGLFSPEITGYGFPVVCTDCFDGSAMYNKDTDFYPQTFKNVDHSYQKPPSSHDIYRNDPDTSSVSNCHQNIGTVESNKLDSNGPAYPSNHERITPSDTQKSHALNSDPPGSYLQPLLRSAEFQQPSASDCLLQQRPRIVSDPVKEDPAKQTLFSNGHLATSSNEHRPLKGSSE